MSSCSLSERTDGIAGDCDSAKGDLWWLTSKLKIGGEPIQRPGQRFGGMDFEDGQSWTQARKSDKPADNYAIDLPAGSPGTSNWARRSWHFAQTKWSFTESVHKAGGDMRIRTI
ncbi:MAG: hypothetical protein R3C56_06635 [Pirellulaceae bacterium]